MSYSLSYKQQNLIWIARLGIGIQLALLVFLFADTVLYYYYVLGQLPELLMIIYHPIYVISRYLFPLFHLICLPCAAKWFPKKDVLRKTLLTGFLSSAILYICNNIYREHLIDYVLTPFVTKYSMPWCFLLALPYIPIFTVILIFEMRISAKKYRNCEE
ncbi:MAG: hypothetical protein K1V97_00255 [Lachnospiraceae bacterium]